MQLKLFSLCFFIVIPCIYPVLSAEDIDDDYNDFSTVEGESGTKQSRLRTDNALKRVGTTYNWDRWEKWSKCGNSCVQIKRRKCIARTQYENGTVVPDQYFYPDADHRGCFGILKRYRLCKDERCKSNNQKLRDEQCEKFNSMPYKENFYNWLGYEKEHNECELYCRPNGSDIIRMMNQSVTDGTTCNRPAVYYTHYYRRRAVCVEGICRAVHSSGAIRPARTYDTQQKCGSVLCEHVSERFNRSKLPPGYNLVATIPVGAMNLSIRQEMPTENLLTLKSTDDHFLINENQRVSVSGTYEFNDDLYEYNREQGAITAKGPLNKPIILLVFVQGLNLGIEYNYTKPVPSVSISEEDELQTHWDEYGQPISESEIENSVDATVAAQLARMRDRKRRKFSWRLLDLGQCNRSCGPGVRTPIFRCIRDSPNRYYSPKRCAFAEKPLFSEDIYRCNLRLCPPYLRSNYSECNCEDGASVGLRTRFVKCVQEQSDGSIKEVATRLCTESDEKEPELQESCSCASYTRRRVYERASVPSPRVYSRLLSAPVEVRSIYNSSKPLRRHLRDNHHKTGGSGNEGASKAAGTWLMSAWRGDCSKEQFCLSSSGSALAYEVRSIYCDRSSKPKSDLCDFRLTPEQKRSCPAQEDSPYCEHGTWYASEWSKCRGDCFNLQRKRVVLCLLDNQVVVEDDQCDLAKRPKAVQNCTLNEVNYCGPQWHYSEWSECSRPCGEGIQRRIAKCLDYDWKQNTLIESNNCKYLEREPVYGSCNTHKCEETNATTNSVQSESDALLQTDNLEEAGELETECLDKFHNCERINRQRLCHLEYYKTYCCLSCRGFY